MRAQIRAKGSALRPLLIASFIPKSIARERNRIMPHCTRTKEDVAGRVADMFRLAERDHDLTIKRLSLLSGMSAETLNTYRNGTAIPLHAFVQLARYIPDDLLTMCVEPAGKYVGSELGDGDLDTAGLEAGEAAHAVQRARHPASPGGVAIVPQERAEIIPILRRAVASGQRAVRA